MVVGMYDIMAVTRNRIGTGSAACGRWGTKRDPGLRICLNTGWNQKRCASLEKQWFWQREKS